MNLDERVKRYDRTAFIYRLLFKRQTEYFRALIDANAGHMELNPGDKVLDMGCGNGSLCLALAERGYDVNGVEASHKMIDTARDIRHRHKKKNPFTNLLIQFLWGDIVAGLPADDKSFEAVFIAGTAHSMDSEHRRLMFREARRLAKKQVIIIDYTGKKSFQNRFYNWLEKSEPEDFIRHGAAEMNEEFRWVNEVPYDERFSLYICKP
ncbi:MAG: class I SAM-dependent methyltransferase [Brevinematales bacterium]|nr:class I SAM-dependent methyltransferase [Brevinematales bacterium]